MKFLNSFQSGKIPHGQGVFRGRYSLVKLTGSVLWIVPAGLLAMVAVLYVFGHSPERDQRAKAHPAKPSLMEQHRTHVAETARTATRLIGRHVQDRLGENIGKVNDLLIDEHSGRIVFVVLASGGFAGMAVRLKPVPPEVLSQATSLQNILALNLEPRSWSNGPVLHKSELTHVETTSVQNIYHYYNCIWLLPTGRNASDTNSAQQYFTLASALIGHRVMSPANEKLGRISDVVFDLDKPQTTRAIFKPADSAKRSFTVPMGDFSIGGEDGSLILNTDPSQSQCTSLVPPQSRARNLLSKANLIE